jgi:hypothetical protein
MVVLAGWSGTSSGAGPVFWSTVEAVSAMVEESVFVSEKSGESVTTEVLFEITEGMVELPDASVAQSILEVDDAETEWG